MAVYRPKRNRAVSKFYVCEFIIHGKRIQESTGSTSKTVAKEYEKRRRAELERAAAGLPTDQKSNRIRTVRDVSNEYLSGYSLSHRANSVLFAKARLARVSLILGDVLLSDVTEERLRAYIRQRQNEKASGRTINMEIGELSRAIGQPWKLLWPKVRKLEERKDIGKALSSEEQRDTTRFSRNEQVGYAPHSRSHSSAYRYAPGRSNEPPVVPGKSSRSSYHRRPRENV